MNQILRFKLTGNPAIVALPLGAVVVGVTDDPSGASVAAVANMRLAIEQRYFHTLAETAEVPEGFTYVGMFKDEGPGGVKFVFEKTRG
jgi:hypothetical protein